MFESIINFFKKMKKSEKEQVKSKDAAKERLHLVLMQDRANVSADFLDLMKQEIIEVIKKYINVDENEIDVRLTNKSNSDGTTGAPALYANIPIVSIKDDSKGGIVRQKKEEDGIQNVINKQNNSNELKQEQPRTNIQYVNNNNNQEKQEQPKINTQYVNNNNNQEKQEQPKINTQYVNNNNNQEKQEQTRTNTQYVNNNNNQEKQEQPRINTQYVNNNNNQERQEQPKIIPQYVQNNDAIKNAINHIYNPQGIYQTKNIKPEYKIGESKENNNNNYKQTSNNN